MKQPLVMVSRPPAWLFPVMALLTFFLCPDRIANAAPEAAGPGALKVHADDYELATDTGWAQGAGHVRIEYQEMILEADKVRVNVQTKEIEAEGNIFFYSLENADLATMGSAFFWRGETIRGNLDTRQFSAGKFSGRLDEWFAVAGDAEFKGAGEAVFRNVHVSTCDYLGGERAHYRIEAREVVYNSEKGRIVAKHAVYKVGDLPIFYWPYVAWDTKSDGGTVKYRVGYRDDWGAFLSVSRGWHVAGNVETEVGVDLMGKRGAGLRSETRRVTDSSLTELHLYGLGDTDPPEDAGGMNRRFDSDSGRYRAKVYHMGELATGLTLRAGVDKLSDIDMLEEWYRREFEDYRQPRNHTDLTYEHERFTVSIGAKFRVNSFYTVSEKLPELRLDMPRQRLFDSPFYYQSETRLAYLRMNWRDFDQDEFWPFFPVDQTQNYTYHSTYETVRLDTVQMLYLPFTAGGLVQVIPRGGLRLTYYGDTSDREVSDEELRQMFRYDNPDLDLPVNNVSLYDQQGGGALRAAVELGVEASTKFTALWNDKKSDFWGLDGLRHVVQPYVNYTFVSEPSEDRENLLYFDETDRLRGENFIRVGAEQRVQTRRSKDGIDQVYTLARVDTYADVHLDRADGREVLGDFVTKATLRPREQIALWGTALADMHDPNFRWFEIGTTLGNPDRMALSLSYIFRDELRRHPITTFGSTHADYTGENITAENLGDVHSVMTAFNFRVNEKTAGMIQYQYDLEEMRLARQIYQLSRDLHCWTGSVFFGDDYGDFLIGFVLQLKAFPGVGIEADIY